MNPETLATKAGVAIDGRPVSCCFYYHICHWEGRLQCLPTNHTQNEHPVFMTLSKTQLAYGLTSHEWLHLSRILFNHYSM